MTRTITAKFDSKCKECGDTVFKGEPVQWTKGEGTKHLSCASGLKVPSELIEGKNYYVFMDDSRMTVEMLSVKRTSDTEVGRITHFTARILDEGTCQQLHTNMFRGQMNWDGRKQVREIK